MTQPINMETSSHPHVAMSKDLVTSSNWDQNVEIMVDIQNQNKFSNQPSAPTNIQDTTPPTSLTSSFQMAPIPKNVTVKMPLGNSHVTNNTDSSVKLTNLTTTNPLTSKNEDYVWLDPNGHVVSPLRSDHDGWNGEVDPNLENSTTQRINTSSYEHVREVLNN